ncbi:MAG: PaaI family thioesterase [Thermus sp.]|uniref:PaaI family thioesterase n=1 Tax=Thermus sp. TaxID=275 RepID=UPI00351BBE77
MSPFARFFQVEVLRKEDGEAELSVSYLRPVREGVLLARGWVVHPGRRLLHAAGEVLWEGKRVAFAKGVFYRVG